MLTHHVIKDKARDQPITLRQGMFLRAKGTEMVYLVVKQGENGWNWRFVKLSDGWIYETLIHTLSTRNYDVLEQAESIKLVEASHE